MEKEEEKQDNEFEPSDRAQQELRLSLGFIRETLISRDMSG